MDTTKKNVTYGKNSTVVFECDLSESEKSSVWYTANDIDVMRKEMRHSLQQEGFSRGLELCFDDNTNIQSKRKCRQNHVKSILDLQQEERNKGTNDAKSLQNLSSMLSKHNVRMAQERASDDSAKAFEIFREIPKFLKATSAVEFAKKTSRRCWRRQLYTPKSDLVASIQISC